MPTPEGTFGAFGTPTGSISIALVIYEKARAALEIDCHERLAFMPSSAFQSRRCRGRSRIERRRLPSLSNRFMDCGVRHVNTRAGFGVGRVSSVGAKMARSTHCNGACARQGERCRQTSALLGRPLATLDAPRRRRVKGRDVELPPLRSTPTRTSPRSWSNLPANYDCQR